MNAETIRRVTLAALRDYEYKLDAHYDGHPNAIEERDIARAAIADIEAGGAWEPVEDGIHWNDIRTRGILIQENGKWLTTLHDGDEGCKVDLADNVLLMRRTTAPQPAAWEPVTELKLRDGHVLRMSSEAMAISYDHEALTDIYWPDDGYEYAVVRRRTTLRKRPDSEATP